jgi:hypothetical protein
MDLLSFVRFRWFWDLTCDFWAENEEIKIMATQRQWIQSLRPSGCALAFGRTVAAGLSSGFLITPLLEVTAKQTQIPSGDDKQEK